MTQHIAMIPYKSALLRAVLWCANSTVARMMLGGCSVCVFYSDMVERYFRRRIRFRGEAVHIANGVARCIFYPVDGVRRQELRESLGWGDDTPTFLFVGRFVEKKGMGLMRELASRFGAVRWVFIGCGPNNPNDWRLPNVITLAPIPHPDLVEYYRAADLCVLLSVGEGLPLAVQESMASGTPVLLSEETARCVAGVRGYGFVSRRTVQCVTEVLQGILGNSNLLTAARKRTTDFAQTHWHDWSECARKYEEVFVRIVRRHSERQHRLCFRSKISWRLERG